MRKDRETRGGSEVLSVLHAHRRRQRIPVDAPGSCHPAPVRDVTDDESHRRNDDDYQTIHIHTLAPLTGSRRRYAGHGTNADPSRAPLFDLTWWLNRAVSRLATLLRWTW